MGSQLVNLLEKDLGERHLSQHEFYKSWNEGTLSMEALRGYAQQYYHFVAWFPRMVSLVHSGTPELSDRLKIVENLKEEEDAKLPHEELWIRFAEGLGLDRNDLKQDMLPETAHLVDTVKQYCHQSYLAGAAALLAYEAQMADIAKLKQAGLIKHFGITDGRTLEFFEVHGEVDIEHQKVWKNMIATRVDNDEMGKEVRQALNASLTALWGMLDGVLRVYCGETKTAGSRAHA